ncbi:MAG: ATP-binding cassette domain-containing protein [Bacteroidetes bacterium]|jgi:putative ABC transport system ATP-binding protein|nr:ATP-binding cassette domain-containing protein [Bacteroidota bacterium]
MILLERVVHRYSQATVLDIPDFQADQAEHHLVLGRSGSGKTTLLHILAGLLRPTAGRVVVAGEDLGALEGDDLDRFRGQHIGIVFQEMHLLRTLTVEENLLLAPYMAGLPQDVDRARTVLHSLEVEEKAHAYPHQLSVGQRQRVAIARAVMNRPRLLLADEPTSSLDDVRAEQVLDLLVQQAEAHEATLLVATHDRRIIGHFSHRLVLDEADRINPSPVNANPERT